MVERDMQANPSEPESDTEGTLSGEDSVRGRGEDGARKTEATPPIADDSQHGQTAVPAPDDAQKQA
jgi:hypothetical protein